MQAFPHPAAGAGSTPCRFLLGTHLFACTLLNPAKLRPCHSRHQNLSLFALNIHFQDASPNTWPCSNNDATQYLPLHPIATPAMVDKLASRHHSTASGFPNSWAGNDSWCNVLSMPCLSHRHREHRRACCPHSRRPRGWPRCLRARLTVRPRRADIGCARQTPLQQNWVSQSALPCSIESDALDCPLLVTKAGLIRQGKWQDIKSSYGKAVHPAKY